MPIKPENYGCNILGQLLLLKEAIVTSYNEPVDKMIKLLSYYYDNSEYEEEIDITENVLKLVPDMKKETKKEAEDFQSRIFFIKHDNRPLRLGKCSLYSASNDKETKKEADRIDIEVFMNKKKKVEEFEPTARHELRHMIIHLQSALKRKNLKKPVSKHPMRYSDYVFDPRETDQAVSAIVDLFRKNQVKRVYLSFNSFIKTVFDRYNLLEPGTKKIAESQAFKNYIIKRFWREGIKIDFDEEKVLLRERK